MGYIFRPGLHACNPGGSLVFLDVAGDRYFALGETATNACLRLIDDPANAPGDSTIVDDLLARDIIRRVEDDIRPALCPPTLRVVSCARDLPPGRARPGAVAAALGRSFWAIVELKTGSLDGALASVMRAKRSVPCSITPIAELAVFAGVFAQADRTITALDRCLPRSIALARTMIAAGVAPDLILGVKLRPFEAHCWVQHGNVLVSDDPGTIAPFTPILAV